MKLFRRRNEFRLLGRTFKVAFDAGTMQRIRTQLGIDLRTIPADGVLEAFLGPERKDMGRFVNLLWECVEPQATGHGITPEQFGHALAARGIDRAADAVAAAFVKGFRLAA